MNSADLEKFLMREKRRVEFYQLLLTCLRCGLIILAGEVLGKLAQYILFGLRISSGWAVLMSGAPLIVGVLIAVRLFYLRFRQNQSLSLTSVAARIEMQSLLFKLKSFHRSELVSVASFLEKAEADRSEFETAHLKFWSFKLPQVTMALYPSLHLAAVLLVSGFAFLGSLSLERHLSYAFPDWIRAWTPSQFEVRLPFASAEWKSETGAIAGISGSQIRFHAPDYFPFKTFLYVREVEETNSGRWRMYPCSEICELKLGGRGQYAVGTLAWRSSIFPLQVSPDESPRGAILTKINTEWVSAYTISILNKKEVELQLSASDDIQLKKMELVHRFQDTTETLKSWDIQESHFKTEQKVSLVGWKGGSHEIYLKISDEIQSSVSNSLTILFADEDTLREKRAQSLRALLDEWVHVLADLLETDADQNLKEGMSARIDHIEYPEIEENSLMNAYVKELHSLGERIQKWIRLSPNISGVKPLIAKTEKAILYGLSLIFQEKTGDIESTANHLKNSQADLTKLLEDLKNGKIDMNSQELEEAFQKMTMQLEELQKKIKELPQGPQDELLNREALEAQAQESQSLADKINDIKNQMANGDSKGAMRELESLLNQLSILSKEMERTLDQWKSNLDQGAMQAQEKYLKKLEELKKRQEELAHKTDKMKEKSEELEEKSQKEWKPIDPKKQKQLAKEFKNLEGEQDRLTKEFQQLTQDFDKALEGSEWQEMLRNSETTETEKNISERMVESKEGLAEQKSFDSLSNQKEAIELMNRLGEGQKKLRDQAQSAQNPQPMNKSEKMEIKSTDKELNAERKRKIMESLRQKVDDRFQKSHEHYFEELLQR